MDDTEIHRHIDELVAEEHRLERAHIGQGLSDAEQARLARPRRRSSTATGTSCASATPAAGRATTPTARRSARQRRRGLPPVGRSARRVRQHRSGARHPHQPSRARRGDRRARRRPAGPGAAGRSTARRPHGRGALAAEVADALRARGPGHGGGRRRRLPPPRVRAARAGPHRPGRAPRRLARRRRRCAARCSNPPRRTGRARCCRGCGTPAPTAPTATATSTLPADGVVRARTARCCWAGGCPLDAGGAPADERGRPARRLPEEQRWTCPPTCATRQRTARGEADLLVLADHPDRPAVQRTDDRCDEEVVEVWARRELNPHVLTDTRT